MAKVGTKYMIVDLGGTYFVIVQRRSREKKLSFYEGGKI